jgi:hypothetical protein
MSGETESADLVVPGDRSRIRKNAFGSRRLAGLPMEHHRIIPGHSEPAAHEGEQEEESLGANGPVFHRQ